MLTTSYSEDYFLSVTLLLTAVFGMTLEMRGTAGFTFVFEEVPIALGLITPTGVPRLWRLGLQRLVYEAFGDSGWISLVGLSSFWNIVLERRVGLDEAIWYLSQLRSCSTERKCFEVVVNMCFPATLLLGDTDLAR